MPTIINFAQIFEKALKTWGEREQSAVAMEECGELIRAINKMHRDPSEENRKELISELADVRIMTNQIVFIYGLDVEEINREIDRKMLRLEERLEVIDEK